MTFSQCVLDPEITAHAGEGGWILLEARDPTVPGCVPFSISLSRVDARSLLEALRRVLEAPAKGEPDGVRIDPFTGRPETASR